MIEFGNEFAWVQIDRDDKGLSPRLKIRDMRSGAVGFLDALELSVLAQRRHEDLAPIMDPGFAGWGSGGDDVPSGLVEFLDDLELQGG